MTQKLKNYGYIQKNLLNLKKKIEDVCNRNGRNPKDICVVAVSKTFPSDVIAATVDFNQIDIGENRVQELLRKHKELEEKKINWHLVGHLQTNKVKYIVHFIYLIQSLDSLRLAEKIQSEASKINRVIDCLIQVNTSKEEQKSGCDIKDVPNLVKKISRFENIRIKGLMTIAKFMTDISSQSERNIVRQNFKDLYNTFNELKSAGIPNVEMKYLSMGMTQDWDIALEEGSNMLRMGTAIFGERNNL